MYMLFNWCDSLNGRHPASCAIMITLRYCIFRRKSIFIAIIFCWMFL